MPKNQKKIFMNISFVNTGFFSLFFLLIITSCTSSRSSTSSSFNKKNSSEISLRNKLIKEAEKHKGIKYKYGGIDTKGFDCSGFTQYVCSKNNIKLSRTSAYQSKQGNEVSLSKAKAGDLLFFGRHGRSGKIQHVGMVIKNNFDGLFMIHSSSSRGICVDNVLNSKYWKPKLLFARKIINLKEK